MGIRITRIDGCCWISSDQHRVNTAARRFEESVYGSNYRKQLEFRFFLINGNLMLEYKSFGREKKKLISWNNYIGLLPRPTRAIDLLTINVLYVIFFDQSFPDAATPVRHTHLD